MNWIWTRAEQVVEQYTEAISAIRKAKEEQKNTALFHLNCELRMRGHEEASEIKSTLKD